MFTISFRSSYDPVGAVVEGGKSCNYPNIQCCKKSKTLLSTCAKANSEYHSLVKGMQLS